MTCFDMGTFQIVAIYSFNWIIIFLDMSESHETKFDVVKGRNLHIFNVHLQTSTQERKKKNRIRCKVHIWIYAKSKGGLDWVSLPPLLS
jgi:hypothetical protein